MKSLKVLNQGDLDYRLASGRMCCIIGPFSSPIG